MLLALIFLGTVASLLAVSSSKAVSGHDDTTAPSIPQNVKVMKVTQTSVRLTWDASTDDVRVAGYRILFGRLPAEQTKHTFHTIAGLSCGQSLAVEIQAYDGVGNLSQSAEVVVSSAPCLDSQAPSAPSGLRQTSNSATAATLAWDPATDNIAVSGYSVSRYGLELATTSEPAYAFTGLACGETHPVAVRAYDVAGNTSNWVSFFVSTAACGDVSAPTAPSGLAQTNKTSTGMSVAWTAATDNVGVARYDVFRNGTLAGSVNALAYTLSGLTCETAYTVGVEAVDGAGNRSSRSSASMNTASCTTPPPPTNDTQPPTVPTNLALSSATPTSLTLSWSPSTDKVAVTGYSVTRNGTQLQVVTGTTYVFEGLSCGTSYQLGVRAYDASGNHSALATVTASPTACSSTNPDSTAPTTPTNLFLLDRTSSSVTISWAASTDDVGVAGYGAYVDGQLDGSTAATNYTFADLPCNATKTFSIDAYDGAGKRSGKANVAFATTSCTDGAPPTTPAVLLVSNPTQNSLTLSWSAASDDYGVAGYDLFVNGSKIATVTGLSSSIASLTCSTSYTLGVEAFDASGNRSGRKTASGTTASCSSPATPGTVYVSPNGSDGALCTVALPCESFDKAYRMSKAGGVVRVAAGNYPTQQMYFDATKESASSRVVFDLDPQASVAGESIFWGVQHVEFRGGRWTKITMKPSDSQGLVPGAKLATDIVISGTALNSFLIRNSQRITIQDSQIGSFDVSTDLGVPKIGAYPAEDGALPQPSRDITLERLSFRDITRAPGASQHAECLFVEGGTERLNVRFSSFTNCAVFDIFFEPRGGLVADVVIEGNTFDTPRDSYGAAAGSAISLKGGPFWNIAIRWNSILGNVRTDSDSPNWGASGTLSFLGNAWKNSSCNTWPSSAYSTNVATTACGSSDVSGDPGFVSSRTDQCSPSSCYRNDFHLVTGGLAVGRGPSSPPSADMDGESRPQGVPDAGADERS